MRRSPLTPVFDPGIRRGSVPTGTTPGEPVTGGLLHDDLLAQGPVGMWSLRETSGTTMLDESTNANDGTYRTGNALASVPGPDGFDYVTMDSGAGIGTQGAQVPALSDYSITGAGLTVCFCCWQMTGGAYIAKTDFTTSANMEWVAFAASGTANLVADVTPNPNRSFYFSGLPLVDGQWNFVIVRFLTPSAGPNLSANGDVPLAYGGVGSGTAVAGGDPLQIGAQTSGGGGPGGPMGLVAIYDTFQSDAWCDARMAVAASEGWY